MTPMDRIKALLNTIYGAQAAGAVFDKILPVIEKYSVQKRKKETFFSHQDVILITYADSLNNQGSPALETLRHFAKQYLKETISDIHFLPFFPYSSDDGFSVMDFCQIRPDLGNWDDVQAIGRDFGLMFDFVVNHFSSQSQWFKNYLEAKPGFEHFAIEVDPSADLSLVTRPRSLPVLSEYKKNDGQTVHLWTTFSEDQIDLNYCSPDVLATMIDVLLFYTSKGATILRMDAIAYLWKQIGTTCIHLAQTHDMVKLFRAVLDLVAPDVIIITETNVPHAENITYFGDGRNEAQMVYNFTLPPLLLYTFLEQDVCMLSQWAKGLSLEPENNTFFNFTASHDGIGVRPLEGILPSSEIEKLINAANRCGGNVSWKQNSDGSQSPYELNITYLDAILADQSSEKTEKFLASQAIQYVLPGVPATYIHSLLGSRNWQEGVLETSRARSINRERLWVEDVIRQLNNPESFRARIFFPYLELIRIRRKQKAFNPNAGFEILDLDSKLFCIKRHCETQTIYAITNISSQPVSVDLPVQKSKDLITGQIAEATSFKLKPYQYVWLEQK
ncbi:MAG: sugar phosphorylase [Desulfobacteraceae bacterium]|nr:sugar phosphorylase [Desulfobacteraceae bacterium]